MADVSHMITRAKVALVGTRTGALYERARWVANAPKRARRRELMDLHLEPLRFDLLLRHLVGRDDHCFDGGCHVGSILAQMVKLAPDGHHIAVEPVAAKAALLRRRFPQVRFVEGALGEAPGRATFFDDESGFASLHPNRRHSTSSASREVAMHTVDDLVGEGRLDLLKLDIEGAELWALRGARRTVERCRPTILLECVLDEGLEPFGYTRADMFAFVTGDLGYDVYSIVDFLYGRAALSAEEFDRAGEYPYRGFNYVCVPTDRRPSRLIPEFGRERLF